MNRRLLASLLTTTFFATAACEDDLNLGKLDGKISAPAEIDFGDVLVGQISKKSIEVKNEGTVSVRVTEVSVEDTFSTQQYEFTVPRNSMTIEANSTVRLEAAFQPFTTQEMPVESTFTIHTDAVGENGAPITVTVKVKGRGVLDALLITPNPVDFGTILAGSNVERDFMVTNRLSNPIDLGIRLGGNGMPDIVQSSGNGSFDFISMVQVDGSLLAPNTKLEPGASATLRARYNAHPSPTPEQDRARIRLATCSDTICEQSVDFVGRASKTGIECLPPSTDYGAINPGRVMTRTITCTNVANDPITVTGWAMSPMSHPEFTATLYDGSVSTVQPQAVFTVDVAFAPTTETLMAGDRRAELVVNAQNTAGAPLDDVRVNFKGSAGGPGLSVAPAALAFGPVVVGTYLEKRLLVSNVGYAPLTISGITIPDMNFSTTQGATTIAAGDAIIVTVRFEPLSVAVFNSVLSIANDDAFTPIFDVPLSGEGIQLPPCQYSVQPSNLTYGVVPLSESAVETARISNIGTDPCLFSTNDFTPPGVQYSLVNGPQSGVMIAAGAFVDVPIEFKPTTSGPQNGIFNFYISDFNNPNGQVPLFGEGEPPCGNGVVDGINEECDDGNPFNGDGCDSNCTFPRCGNGVISPGEQCDDGNNVPNDGCEIDCSRSGTCGNFILEIGEDCDDGNLIPGDGCDPQCYFELCGNNVIDPGEICDDGNRVGGDGCSAQCQDDTFLARDIVSAGQAGLRGLGIGQIQIAGITGPIGRALLFWNGPTNSADFAANAVVNFNGTYVTGVNVGFSSDNCWGFQNSHAYRADVTALVAGDGTYTLADFVKPGVDVNGVSLIVFFDDGNPNNDFDITLYEGNDSNIFSPFDPADWNQNYPVGNFIAGQQAFLEVHVSDGQAFDDGAIMINNQQLVAPGMNFSGDSVPSAPGCTQCIANPAAPFGTTDGLWDIHRYDMTSLMSIGPQNLNLVSATASDCLSLVVTMVMLTSP